MNPYAQILTTAFEAESGLKVKRAFITEDEEIIVLTDDGRKWVMLVGSDDDGFYFHHDTGNEPDESTEVVVFDYPQGWIDLESDGTTEWPTEVEGS